jgi:hypothetical protein
MKAAAIGAFVGVLLSLVAVGLFSAGVPAQAQANPAGVHRLGTEDLITSTTLVAENRQLVTIIDPKSRVMAVYLIEGATGQVSLKSVRPVHWDLQLAEFNCTSPLPQEIRSLVEHTR